MYSVPTIVGNEFTQNLNSTFRVLAAKEGENTMRRSHAHFVMIRVSRLAVFSALVLALFAVGSRAQERKLPQTVGVDNSKMGPYRALAQLAYAASQKGDNANAAMLAKILERTWDKAEDYGGDTALSKTNHSLFEEVDKAMDQFVNMLIEHPNSTPDVAKLKAAYGAYLEKLKQAD